MSSREQTFNDVGLHRDGAFNDRAAHLWIPALRVIKGWVL
jgi:hypothetical protein